MIFDIIFGLIFGNLNLSIKMNRLIIILLFITSSINTALSQNYHPPVDFRMLLSGTFGELRNNHFHAGIDIKTKGVEGQKIYAIEEGYISRIKVSTWGYGKAIYINHPDGKTSVYAHLRKFNKEIQEYVKKQQYKREKYNIDISVQKNLIKVTKGQVIAESGNTGSSSGAHLHFEIRETKTETPINPLKFNFDVKDDIPPFVKDLKIYTKDKSKEKIFSCVKKDTIFTLQDTPIVIGDFALGVSTYDKLNDAYNKNGVYSIKAWVDSMLIYHFEVDKLDFNTNRHINAHIDYREKSVSKKKFHRCFKLPFNKLLNYKKLINDGWVESKDKLRQIKILIEDIKGNSSNIEFKINNISRSIENPSQDTVKKVMLYYNKSNTYKSSPDQINFEMNMLKYSLYENTEFIYEQRDSIEGIYGKVHRCHFEHTPLNKSYTISIKPTIPKDQEDKIFIAKIDKNGNFWNMGGSWDNMMFSTKVKEFGDFCIVSDTINPIIKGVNIYPGKTLKKQASIKFTIEDKESGIDSYRGEIDGKWILMEYDYKKKLLRFDIDDSLKKGEHNLVLKVKDKVGNETKYTAKFIY